MLNCAADGRVCVDGEVPRCGDCLEGRVAEGGQCRLPVVCDELNCGAQNRSCTPAAGQDAVCGDCLEDYVESAGVCVSVGCDALDCLAQNRTCDMGAIACGGCLAGFIEMDGACIAEPDDCMVLDCGSQNRICTVEPEPACAGCLDGFVEQDGACVVPPDPCEVLDCGSQNRACDRGPETVCGACLEGFVEEDGACLPPAIANCEPGARGSIAADCDALNRTCEPGEIAVCGGCADGFVEDAEGACVPPVNCDDLDCVALGRACDGEPFAACGDCAAGTRPADPEDPGSACVAPLTCADIACDDGEFCLEAIGLVDAVCSASPCEDGSAFRADRNVCVACNLNCGEEGETGAVWPFTQAFSDDCICETESGFYADVAGAIRALPCDADGDGWVRLSARASIESEDSAIADNARCQLREITTVTLQNELGQRHVLRSCEDGFAEPGAPDCALTPLGLYETVRNDDALTLSRDADVPAYAGGGVGRALRPSEVNSLTKACVSARADHNHNGIADLGEHHNADAPADLDLALRPFLALSYFIELHRGFYEAPAEGELYGTYVIAERSRCADAFPLGYADGEGDYWRSCMRNRDVGYASDPAVFAPVGYDFARFSCDAADGTCPTPPPVTADGAPDEVVPHDLCVVPAPADDIWRGMSHHSQFRCVVVTNDAELTVPRGLAPQEIAASELYNAVQGSRVWQFNACGVACPDGDADCALDCGDDGCAASSAVPGGLANPSEPVLSCAPIAQSENDDGFAAGTVGFVAARYVDVDGAYARGCINEWEPGSEAFAWKDLCPGYAENPGGVVGDANGSNFGRLLCGCGFGYGGDDCALGCPSLGIDTDGDGVLDTDVGGLHYGGDVDNPLCDNGYCPSDPFGEDGGRRGLWMCGAFSVTSMHGADAATPHALTGGAFTVRGSVMPHGFSGVSCQGDDCAQGWSARPANLADLDN
jgi:hypothetical protein